MNRIHALAETVKEKISTGSPSLNSIFHTTHGILELAPQIKDEENACIGLLTMTAKLVLGVEKKSASESVSGLNDGFNLNLSTLVGTLDQIRAVVSRITTSRYSAPFVNYEIAWLQRQLEEEAMVFEVSIECPNIPVPSDAEFRLFVSDIKMGGSLAPYMSNWSAYDIRTFITSMGIKDLTRRIQILGKRPAAHGVNTSTWSGKLLDGPQVAMKVLDLRMVSGVNMSAVIGEFIHDAIVWSYAMHHENILPLLGVAQLANSVALVSPWMDLGTLHQCVVNHPEVSAGSLVADVARGLSYLHARGIVYGNLRFSTVLVSGAGRAYLSSFLFANFYQEIHPTLKRSVRGATLEDDVFYFGRLIFQPSKSHSNNLTRIIKSAKHDDGRLLKGISDDLWPIIRICMHSDPTQRPSIFEVAHGVVLLAEESLFPYPSSASESPRALKDISKEIKKRDEHPITGGGASDLYLGERKGEKVALKLIRFFGMSKSDTDAARRRFNREASLWASLSHRRILELYGICNHGAGALFMVTPWLKNGTITEYLSTVKLDANRTSLLAQAAEGLLYLHNRHPPVVHGDLKGSNILITNSGTAVLADFGLSKPNNETTTTMLQGAGSPRWMAPELLKVGVDRPVKSQESDIYAFGHVILEVLSGKLPFFHLRDDIHVIVEIINGGRSPRPDGAVADTWLNDSAWTLCQECTAIDADNRPDILAVNHQLNYLTDGSRNHSVLLR